MSRSLSTTVKQAMNASQTDKVFLLLLTINHASLASPIRVVNNTENITSNGNLYVAFPFEIALPDEREDALPRMRLRIDNVDQTIIVAIRSITSAATVTVDIVLADAPNTLEATFAGFTLKEVSYDALVIEGTLYLEDVLNEPYPADSFTPNLYAGLF